MKKEEVVELEVEKGEELGVEVDAEQLELLELQQLPSEQVTPSAFNSRMLLMSTSSIL